MKLRIFENASSNEKYVKLSSLIFMLLRRVSRTVFPQPPNNAPKARLIAHLKLNRNLKRIEITEKENMKLNRER